MKVKGRKRGGTMKGIQVGVPGSTWGSVQAACRRGGLGPCENLVFFLAALSFLGGSTAGALTLS